VDTHVANTACSKPVTSADFEFITDIVGMKFRGRKIGIPSKEARFLALLLSRPGEYFLRHEVMSAVWPQMSPAAKNHSLPTTKNSLIKTLKDSGIPVKISCSRRCGYVAHIL
jgi:DNA-binding winged helix-turn-helix (wHTH) protein